MKCQHWHPSLYAVCLLALIVALKMEMQAENKNKKTPLKTQMSWILISTW